MTSASHPWSAFFTQFRQRQTGQPLSPQADGWQHFFSEFKRLHRPATALVPAPAPDLDPHKLRTFFDGLAPALQASRYHALAFNPVDFLGLERNEVRVVSLLAWLLDPKASHGLGYSPLQAVLTHLGHGLAPSEQGRCQVRTETYIHGSRSDRVDIEIEGEHFYWVIEAKIDAPDQDNQIARYCHQAQTKAQQHGLRWGVLYLTCDGRTPSLCETDHEGYAPYVHTLSWRMLATLLQQCLKGHQTNRSAPCLPMQSHADFFVSSYVKHIQSL